MRIFIDTNTRRLHFKPYDTASTQATIVIKEMPQPLPNMNFFFNFCCLDLNVCETALAAGGQQRGGNSA